ncbi:hypothetical protein H096_21363 [Pseudomonas sp. FH1]|nr:hypothetical protein H096_21363 [Pseudomonas sp. FH1]
MKRLDSLQAIGIFRIQLNISLGSKKPEKTRINYFWDETHKEEKFRKAIMLRLSAGKHPMLRLTV